jgi:hypothetical protein
MGSSDMYILKKTISELNLPIKSASNLESSLITPPVEQGKEMITVPAVISKQNLKRGSEEPE